MVKGIVPEANQEAFLVTLKWQPSMPNELLSQAFACMDFTVQAKMVIALAFVPTHGLEQAIDSLAGHFPDELQQLLDYFEDSYVGRRNR
ncbi:hypothetical protein T10_2363 [Trichinella papuae]|uniref:Uncharacterized protein n=1 Tax=Trichinella papuae TaxID=268474 RepID=A0A0V1M1S5_9BILA|nr:hypothetical protein T10_2363 [Trichinella papuae]